MARSWDEQDPSRVLWVWQLTRYIKEALDSDPLLNGIWVRGEISNFKHHSSGHMYFTLKDEHSSLRCVMFRGKNQGLAFSPKNGARVVGFGSISVYERDGGYQLYVDRLVEDGLGTLHQAFVELKSRLEAEGLFEPSRKRRLPVLPRCVAVVTSPTGAAIRDIVTVACRRLPNCRLLIAPVLVQGPDAPAQIVRALENLNRLGTADVIIVGRGGGSLEELWAFNDERVARAIFSSRIPVVSAVGHETDVTISDLVADVRAPTPSAAAEVVMPVRSELSGRISTLGRRAHAGVQARMVRACQRLERLTTSAPLSRPGDRIRQRQQLVDELGRRSERSTLRRLEAAASRLAVACGRLRALSPRAVIQRGYAVCRRPDGSIVFSTKQVRPGDGVDVVVGDGEIACDVRATSASPTAEVEGSRNDNRLPVDV